MKLKIARILPTLLFVNFFFAQQEPTIHLKYSKLLATYEFVQMLSEQSPDNAEKSAFQASSYNVPENVNLIRRLDTLDIHESFQLQGFTTGTKIPIDSKALIDRALINATTIDQLKQNMFGLIQNSELIALADIIQHFVPVYEELIYLPQRDQIEEKLQKLQAYVDESKLSQYFQQGLLFYDSQWDRAIPIDIALIPKLSGNGFSARAFLNSAVVEIPLKFTKNEVLFGVLMHEIYHNIYDVQSKDKKQEILSWFYENTSKNSQNAYLLMNEVLATVLGNGYVYGQLTGTIDANDWYNVKYINLMSKALYPRVESYLKENKPMDRSLTDHYIALYDSLFSDWANELTHLLTNRYIISDNEGDLNEFNHYFPNASYNFSYYGLDLTGIEQAKNTPMTKVVLISKENKQNLALVKASFPELAKWTYAASKDFVYSIDLADRTKLLIINRRIKSLETLFSENFKDGKLR